MERLTAAQLSRWLQPRDPCAHKGDNGRLLIIGGDQGLAGAIRMTGEAALRVGAGLVRVLTHEENQGPLLTARPELMVEPLNDHSLRQGLAWADVIVIGPGLGQGDWGKNALRVVDSYDKPMLWDADALNLLAFNPQKRHNRIVTPHPGEAARLLNSKVGAVESNRFLAAENIVKLYGGVVVLKGAGTLIAGAAGQTAIADVGNAGMASGGMGDVLSGIIGGLLAQKLSLYDAACAGCVVHGATADWLAAEKGTRGLLATDLLPALYRFVNPECIA
jgi:NAD(P)H-hydrate epimerase